MCICVLLVILVLGLAPFHAPRNEVTWLGTRNGLRFGDHGTVISSGEVNPFGLGDRSACSVEIWMRSSRRSAFNTFLAFYAPENPQRLSLHQSLSDLALSIPTLDKSRHWTYPMLYVDDVFRDRKTIFVTVISSPQNTSIYIDGSLAKSSHEFPFHGGDCTGRLILGDSALQPDSWSGQMLGLAIYDRALTPAEAARGYRRWITEGRPEATAEARPIDLYLFDERSGNRVRDHGGAGVDLDIPTTYSVLGKIMLQPFWNEFQLTESYWIGNLKNIIGFIPLGFCFFAYFGYVLQVRRAVLMTAILGAVVSLTIEVLQAYLPTRDSGTTDVITNTLGTVLGVMLHKTVVPAMVGRCPWLELFYPVADSHREERVGA